MRRPTTIADEPLTFEPQETHPLAGWLRAAGSLIGNGEVRPFPAPVRRMTDAEAESAFHMILALTGKVTVHQTEANWNTIWSHWAPHWGHAQQPCSGGGSPRRQWMDQFFDPSHLDRYATPLAVLGWLRQPGLEGPAEHLWPKATCLTPWNETSHHWTYQALLGWWRVHQPKDGGKDDEARAMPARRQAWTKVMDLIDARLSGLEKSWEWPSHWRIWHAQERTFLDSSLVASTPADLPPVHRPALSVKGFSEMPMWVSMKRHWALRIARGWRYQEQGMDGKLEAGKKYLLFPQDTQGDAEAIRQMTQALSGNPVAKSQWERLLLASAIDQVSTTAARTARTRQRL